MFFKFDSRGYFGGVNKVSRHPMYKVFFVEDDGLDWFYSFNNSDGQICYLLSNNLTVEDRERMSNLYKTMVRNNFFSWFMGMFGAVEASRHITYLRTMALGWRVPAVFGLGYVFK